MLTDKCYGTVTDVIPDVGTQVLWYCDSAVLPFGHGLNNQLSSLDH